MHAHGKGATKKTTVFITAVFFINRIPLRYRIYFALLDSATYESKATPTLLRFGR